MQKSFSSKSYFPQTKKHTRGSFRQSDSYNSNNSSSNCSSSSNNNYKKCTNNNSKMIPHVVMAACWTPLGVTLVLALLASSCFVLWHRPSASSGGARPCAATSAAATLALSATLLTALLVPADVFLVSSMRARNGTYKPWAMDPADRASMENAVLYTYYGFYAFLLLLAFLLLPLSFFFELFGGSREGEEEEGVAEGEDGEVPEAMTEVSSAGGRLWRAAKWTSLCVAAFGGLILIGIFVPWGDVKPDTVPVDAFAAESEVTF